MELSPVIAAVNGASAGLRARARLRTSVRCPIGTLRRRVHTIGVYACDTDQYLLRDWLAVEGSGSPLMLTGSISTPTRREMISSRLANLMRG